ncbi:MAG: hypothetical protein OJF49_000543 [Ktedonobacterales bacterium]|jgi:hypothetical protein|nr:MAG: hypothetical protein OJF49_000543 [Ktedonobacterales bacterium]
MTLPAHQQPGMTLARWLLEQLHDPAFLPVMYPALFARGIDDGALHAYMLSALVLVGHRLGYSPVCDSPIFDRLDKLLMGEGAKRPDAVWFSRTDQTPRCLVEFERYTPNALAPKARNLLIMGKQISATLDLIVLDYWTYIPVPDAQLAAPLAIFSHGFTHATGMSFSALPCPALVLETQVEARDGKTAISHVAPRLVIADGEHKPYMLRELTLR